MGISGGEEDGQMGHGNVKVDGNPHSVFVSLYADLACLAVNPLYFSILSPTSTLNTVGQLQ